MSGEYTAAATAQMERLTAITDPAADIAAARALVSALCKGDRWRMSIPVHRDDSDMLLVRVIVGYRRALDELAELKAAATAVALVEVAP